MKIYITKVKTHLTNQNNYKETNSLPSSYYVFYNDILLQGGLVLVSLRYFFFLDGKDICVFR